MLGQIEKKLISCLVSILCTVSVAEKSRRDFAPTEPDSFIQNQDQFDREQLNRFQNLTPEQLQNFNEFFGQAMIKAQPSLRNLDADAQQELREKIFNDALAKAKKPRDDREGGGGGAGGGGTPGPSGQPFGVGAAQLIGAVSAAAIPAIFANSEKQIAGIQANRDKKLAQINADVAKKQTDGAVKMFDNALKADQNMQKTQLDSKLKQKEMDTGVLSKAMAQQFALQAKSQTNKMQSDLIDLKYKASLSALQAKIQSDDSQVLQTLLTLRGLRNRPMGAGNGLMVTNMGGGAPFYPITNPLFRSNLSYASQNRFVLGSNRTDLVKNSNNVFAATPTSARGISSFHVNQPGKTNNLGAAGDQAHTRR